MTTLNWLTLNEVASKLGKTYMQVYRLVQRRELPAEMKGNVWLVLDRDLDRWLKERQVAG
jgi:excisionase family DNA binding protein